MEQWREIPGHPKYEVSNEGRIRRIGAGRLMAGSSDKKGYRKVRVNGRQSGLVHRLVMFAFVGPCPSAHEVNHKDGDPSNNFLTNLEYVTKSENQKYSLRVLGRHRNRGTVHGMSKLSDEQIQEIRMLRPGIGAKRMRINSGPLRLKYIAERYGVSPAMISLILNRRNWKHI